MGRPRHHGSAKQPPDRAFRRRALPAGSVSCRGRGGGVEGLEAGLYGYLPGRHAIEKVCSGDLRQSLAAACLGQSWMAQAPAMFLFAAEYDRTQRKYGTRGQRYAWMEAGHACQNLLLEVEALGLAAAVVGAFDDRRLSENAGLPSDRHPLAVVTVGRRR